MDPEDTNRTEVVGADRLGALNREEAINELLLIDPSLPKPLNDPLGIIPANCFFGAVVHVSRYHLDGLDFINI
ncbi:MAG: hypothetical protein OSB27_05755 [Planktomarina sp.]|jgi:hypothetical protein|nr:hypothetical protein [Planktomarina sp.]